MNSVPVSKNDRHGVFQDAEGQRTEKQQGSHHYPTERFSLAEKLGRLRHDQVGLAWHQLLQVVAQQCQ